MKKPCLIAFTALIIVGCASSGKTASTDETATTGEQIAEFVQIMGLKSEFGSDNKTNIRNLRGHGTIVYSLSFSLDGSMRASESMDATVNLWLGNTTYIYQESPDTPEYRISTEAFASEISATPLAPVWELFIQYGPEALIYYKEHGLEAAKLYARFQHDYCPR